MKEKPRNLKMKKKKHIKRNNDRKNFGGRDRGEKFSNKRSMRSNDQQRSEERR